MENSSESNVANGTPSTPEEAPTSDTAPPGDSVTKPVNPLRLARPLEKSPAGLIKAKMDSNLPQLRPHPRAKQTAARSPTRTLRKNQIAVGMNRQKIKRSKTRLNQKLLKILITKTKQSKQKLPR